MCCGKEFVPIAALRRVGVCRPDDGVVSRSRMSAKPRVVEEGEELVVSDESLEDQRAGVALFNAVVYALEEVTARVERMIEGGQERPKPWLQEVETKKRSESCLRACRAMRAFNEVPAML